MPARDALAVQVAPEAAPRKSALTQVIPARLSDAIRTKERIIPHIIQPDHYRADRRDRESEPIGTLLRTAVDC